MSAYKRSECETKIVEDENTDSGIVSGPIDLYSGEVEPEPESDDKKVCVSAEQADSELDSGVVCLSECLSGVQLSDYGTQPSQFAYTVSSPELKDIPPIVIFFQQDSDGDTWVSIWTL